MVTLPPTNLSPGWRRPAPDLKAALLCFSKKWRKSSPKGFLPNLKYSRYTAGSKSAWQIYIGHHGFLKSHEDLGALPRKEPTVLFSGPLLMELRLSHSPYLPTFKHLDEETRTAKEGSFLSPPPFGHSPLSYSPPLVYLSNSLQHNRQRSTPTPDPRLFNGFGLYRRVSSLSAPLYCIPILQRFFKLSRKHAKFLNWTPSMYGGNRMYTLVSFRSLVFLELHPPNTTPWFLP